MRRAGRCPGRRRRARGVRRRRPRARRADARPGAARRRRRAARRQPRRRAVRVPRRRRAACSSSTSATRTARTSARRRCPTCAPRSDDLGDDAERVDVAMVTVDPDARHRRAHRLRAELRRRRPRPRHRRPGRAAVRRRPVRRELRGAHGAERRDRGRPHQLPVRRRRHRHARAVVAVRHVGGRPRPATSASCSRPPTTRDPHGPRGADSVVVGGGRRAAGRRWRRPAWRSPTRPGRPTSRRPWCR